MISGQKELGVTFDAKATDPDPIPDKPGAEKGLNGIKAPAGVRQTGDIEDRLRAAGVIPPLSYIKN